MAGAAAPMPRRPGFRWRLRLRLRCPISRASPGRRTPLGARAAALVPVYASVGASSAGAASHGSATLVGVTGWRVLLVVGVPLVATALVGGALWRRGPRK